MRILLVLLFSILVAACQPEPNPEASEQPLTLAVEQRDETLAAVDATNQTVSFRNGMVALRVNKPATWESFSTENGIVISEHFGSVATGGVLEGVMTYTFVLPLRKFTPETGTELNRAQEILNEMLSDPNHNRGFAYTPPAAFTWEKYDAAYTLLAGADGNVTMMLGVAVPEIEALLSCSITSPHAQHARIREMLPILLDGLAVNNIVFDGDDLNSLPDPLDFPEYPHP